jgi:FkbM family methyltransferase
MFLSSQIKNIARAYISSLQGKIKYQKVFENLHMIALKGMNYSISGGVYDSGEIYVLHYVKDRTKVDRNSILIFDVGAHSGEYTSLALKEVGSNLLQVYAFEPTESLFLSLNKKYHSNQNVNIYNFGFGDKKEVLPFYVSESNPYLNSVYNRDLKNYNLELKQLQKISLERIDDFCEQNSINKINLLKIDVEGYELKVLQGAEAMINSGSIDYIQLEFGGCHIDSRTYFRDIFNYLNSRYKIYRVLKNGLRPIERYDERLEIFMTANFFAELR